MRKSLSPLGVAFVLLGLWFALVATGWFHQSALPRPGAVWTALRQELISGRLLRDTVTSLFRVFIGFALAIGLGIPLGIYLGEHTGARQAFLPAINFFRNLSPLAWIPFAILWFGVGDAPSIFLIFLAAIFPVLLATIAAVATIPSVYFRVARNFELSGWERLRDVTFPAILPDVITNLRLTAGVCWLVVVAAEMIAGRDGLGFAVMDSRNGLRTDLLVVNMIAIGLIGVALDRVLLQMTRMPAVRWGYER